MSASFKIIEEWRKADNGFEIYTRIWEPAAKLIATVTFVHGLGEHCSRYDHLFGPFAEAGIKVIAYDQRGFGKTCRKSGIIGHSEGIKTVLADIKWAEDRVRTDKIPHFVMGHSMGGNIALRYALEMGDKLKGCITSAPLVRADKKSEPHPIIKAAGIALSTVLGTVVIDNGVDAKFLSRDPQVVATYKNDPNVHSMVSLTTASDFFQTADMLLEKGWKSFNVPLLIAHGTADYLTCPKASKEFFDKAVVKDKEYSVFEGWYHELHNEKDNKLVIDKYISWIKAHI